MKKNGAHECFMTYMVVIFLGTFVKLRKTTTSFVTSLSVRPSASAPTGRIFIKFFLKMYENLSKNLKLKSDKKNGYFTRRPIYVFFWRVNVLYIVGIGCQPEKTWRHRELTAPEVVVRNHGNGGINNNMAAQQTPPTSRLAMNARRGSATMVTAE